MRDTPLPSAEQMSKYMIEVMRGLNAQLFREVGNRAIGGLFKGMTIMQEPFWEDGNASTKLLGCYEFELEGEIIHALERNPKTIINIGCAEGYYAVGFAMRLPEAKVIAIDVSKESLSDCHQMAEENGVADRMEFYHGCWGAEQLKLDAAEDRRLYFLDCEGWEFDLLVKNDCSILSKSDIIVECHEFFRPGITEMIQDRFKDTHEMRVIRPLLPPLDRYPFLAETPSVMNLLAVTEKRPMPTRWLACWAH